MVPDGQTITDRELRNVKYCRYMYGMFGVKWLAVQIIGGENRLKNHMDHVVTTWSMLSDQIANISDNTIRKYHQESSSGLCLSVSLPTFVNTAGRDS